MRNWNGPHLRTTRPDGVTDLIATGARVGLALGVTTAPVTARLVAAPPVSRSESDLSSVRPIKAPWPPAAITVGACALTGLASSSPARDPVMRFSAVRT